MATEPVSNGTIDVPSIIYDPVVVTKENVNDTIVADGYWTPEEICTGLPTRRPAQTPGSSRRTIGAPGGAAMPRPAALPKDIHP